MRKTHFDGPAKLPFPLGGPDAQVAEQEEGGAKGKKMLPTLKIFYPVFSQSPIGNFAPSDLSASPTAKYQPQHRLNQPRPLSVKALPPGLPFSVSSPRPVSLAKLARLCERPSKNLS